MTLPRMRTIPGTIKYFKDQDPDTAINESWLRVQIKTGNISYIKAGKRFLLNLDAVENLLKAGEKNNAKETVGNIRRINI